MAVDLWTKFDRRKLAAVWLLFVMCSTASWARTPTVEVRMAIERERSGNPSVVLVTIRNVREEMVCLQRNFGSWLRLTAVRNGNVIKNAGFDPRPTPGCHELRVGDVEHLNYDARQIYPNDDLHGARLCYGVTWRVGSSESSPLRRSDVCKNI